MIKSLYYCLVFEILFCSISACTNHTTIDPTSPENAQKGDVTGLGQPTGTAITKLLGPVGGTLSTDDGKIQLVIPAGALTEAVNISLQPITNETPNGLGIAYRILPADVKLAKPATLITQYSETELAGNALSTIGLACQHPDKIWYSAVGQAVDATKRQLSVPVTRFGDWSSYCQFVLQLKNQTDVNVAYYGESLGLEVRQIIPVSAQNEDPLRIRILQTADKNSYEWSLDGHGKLIANQANVLFTAPNYHPYQNPVTVVATVTPANSTQKIILKQDIFVGAGYIRYTFNGQSTYCTTVSLQDQSTGYATVLGASDTTPINLTFRSASYGIWPFGDYITTDGKSGVALSLIKDGQQDRYDTGHSQCNGQKWFANGQLALMAYVKGKVARGSFSGNLINRNSTCTSAGPAISGEFLVKMPGNN